MEKKRSIGLREFWPTISNRFIILHYHNGTAEEIYAADYGKNFDYIETGKGRRIHLAAIKKITFPKK